MTLSLARRRDPFADFDALVRHTFGPDAFTAPGFSPAAEVTRDEDDAVIAIELPGVDVANDVTVEVDNGQLVVRGERRDENSEEQRGRRLREFRYGAFRRAFTLPGHITSDAIDASYDAGVLKVRVSGAYAGKTAERIEINTAPQLESN